MSKPDPGGVFESDDHRRVLGHLPPPHAEVILGYHAEQVPDRVAPDPNTLGDGRPSVEDALEVLQDLEASGFAVKKDDGWAQTDLGFEALTGENDATY